MKVRCIEDGFDYITKGVVYDAVTFAEDWYKINGHAYCKRFFEEVKMKVRCIEDGFHNVTKGVVYEVKADSEYWYAMIGDNGDRVVYNKEIFEEVKEMTKSDLVAGEHVVECDNGNRYLFTGKTFVADNNEWLRLSNLNEDLTIGNDSEGFSVKRVLAVKKECYLSAMLRDAIEVWTREPSEYDKLMEQIEELKAQAEKMKP